MIRPATSADLPAMVALSEAKRTEYERYQPVFWRKAPDSAAVQAPFFTALLQRPNVIALVHEERGVVDGFLIADLIPSPPVYAPGGLTCRIDDYCVASGADWEQVGLALLRAAEAAGAERGAVQTVVVCGHLDLPKRAMLAAAGYSIASEWWTRPIGDE
ncbi:MAG: N-acetyltransferase [Bacillota bacterium]